MRILNITNGDSAVSLMQQAGVPGDILAWRDVLHDGPVPGGLSLTELSQRRAAFIAENGWGSEADIQRSFIERDQMIASCSEYDKVLLWFEHDLYDQLQILQILDYLHQHCAEPGRLSMICTDQYLGCCSPAQIRALRQYETAVTRTQLILAHEAWEAFCAPTPAAWCALLTRDTSSLPFLKAAVLRQLQEYPDVRHGLSRSAYQALHVVAGGESRADKVFKACQNMEERVFMGDSSFWNILQSMLDSSPALLSMSPSGGLALAVDRKQMLSITDTGKAVLEKQRNWLDMIRLDSWIGGVHLGAVQCWCWDAELIRVVQCDRGLSRS